jgi:hypothetical protein
MRKKENEKPIWEPRNPVGCGLYRNAEDADGKPLPNIEDPSALIASFKDRPPPIGLGPIARHWQPRLGFGGTYDTEWQQNRAPLWPTDFDERFFCAGAAGLVARSHLQGGEKVFLEGLSPKGVLSFNLPRISLQVKTYQKAGTSRARMKLDAVQIDTDLKCLTLIYRDTSIMPDGFENYRQTIVRKIEDWESSA